MIAIASYKHSNLLGLVVSDEGKSFIILTPGVNPRVEPLKGASLGKALSNIRLVWKGLSVTNTSLFGTF